MVLRKPRLDRSGDELTITRASVVLGKDLAPFHAMRAEIRLVHLGTSAITAGITSSRYRVGS